MEVILAEPRGFCAGVKRAIEILTHTLAIYKNKCQVYVLHEIVHNTYIIEQFIKQGAIFIEHLEEIQDNSGVLVFSAHGVSKNIEEQAKRQGLTVIDTTCPLVRKVHHIAQEYEKNGQELILIGHANHPEVNGIIGRVKNPIILVQSLEDVKSVHIRNPHHVSYITQTTLSIDETSNIIDAIKLKYPDIKGRSLSNICYATHNRQNAIKMLSKRVDMVLIIGSANSSNARRLLEICMLQGQKKAFLIENHSYIKKHWFKNINKIGITAGASVPNILINELIEYFEFTMDAQVSVMPYGIFENINFKDHIKL
ncbi:4-hydroxy-3-methylbut-2-enyl diphosphate reductase [Wolbachia endosymbiont of Howardula sp.]|uniref:4-hydroxy-3-methylbut-2-enyl diphosphate reductase n=1 Tax=Wolbachia endosymbiont of Howardula sp. TaxID=2916816 RepID=UPI00217ED081|nr:4-hydroxy-3-methylbut-2-enyl diphosphate reductase [Wolbachia endosymbiont of Howardula sp.]UWI83109.1 4-hydroxy-3-methylbut-2-enyl diphosphate reductase [Wolbachia endosymbiont of Howardula sp.]